MVAELEALSRSTEEDFLAVGGKLAEFSAAARQISSGLAELSELMSGTRTQQATQALAHVQDQLRQTEARLEAAGGRLASVSATARRIAAAFVDFRGTVAAFHVLGSLTRIETARLGNQGAGFGNLAEEVKALTESIESGGQGVLQASSLLRAKMESAVAGIAATRETAMRELPSVVAEITASMAALAENEKRAQEASRRQASEYKDVSAAFEDLVGALQFHDITRQKVEHVVQALRRLEAAPQREAAAVLQLESAQLADAERVFAASVGRVERDLDAVGQRVAEMAGESGRLLGDSADHRHSFFSSLEARFGTILAILNTCFEAEADTQSAFAGLDQDVGRMREAATEVGEIGIRLRRMAINATIRASQIGPAGRALDVLAEVMQRLANDSQKLAGEAAAALDAMTEATGASPAAESPELSRGDRNEILHEVQRTIGQIRASGESSFARLSQVTAQGSGLREGIAQVRKQFSAGIGLSQAIRRACASLDESVARARLAAGGGPSVDSLDALERQYTMQSEREVHRAVTQEPQEPPPAVPVAAGAVENDLGDNVELF